MKPQKEKKKKGKERLCKEIMAKKISKSVVGNQHSVSWSLNVPEQYQPK